MDVVVLPVAAANERYVLRIARCCCVISSNNAELKLGQNIHKNIVPTIANISDTYVDPSFELALFVLTLFSSRFGRITKLTAKPKYAPKAWTVIEPPASVIYVIVKLFSMNKTQKTALFKWNIIENVNRLRETGAQLKL